MAVWRRKVTGGRPGNLLVLFDPAAAEDEEVAGGHFYRRGRAGDLVVDAEGAELESVAGEIPTEAMGGDAGTAADGNERDHGPGGRIDGFAVFDERDLEEVIDNRYARFAAKASDHREVGEGVVGPAAGGCGDVNRIAALFDAESDRFFEVGGIERGVVVER